MDQGSASRTPGGFFSSLVFTPFKSAQKAYNRLTRASSSPNLAEDEDRNAKPHVRETPLAEDADRSPSVPPANGIQQPAPEDAYDKDQSAKVEANDEVARELIGCTPHWEKGKHALLGKFLGRPSEYHVTPAHWTPPEEAVLANSGYGKAYIVLKEAPSPRQTPGKGSLGPVRRQSGGGRSHPYTRPAGHGQGNPVYSTAGSRRPVTPYPGFKAAVPRTGPGATYLQVTGTPLTTRAPALSVSPNPNQEVAAAEATEAADQPSASSAGASASAAGAAAAVAGAPLPTLGFFNNPTKLAPSRGTSPGLVARPPSRNGLGNHASFFPGTAAAAAAAGTPGSSTGGLGSFATLQARGFGGAGGLPKPQANRKPLMGQAGRGGAAFRPLRSTPLKPAAMLPPPGVGKKRGAERQGLSVLEVPAGMSGAKRIRAAASPGMRALMGLPTAVDTAPAHDQAEDAAPVPPPQPLLSTPAANRIMETMQMLNSGGVPSAAPATDQNAGAAPPLGRLEPGSPRDNSFSTPAVKLAFGGVEMTPGSTPGATPGVRGVPGPAGHTPWHGLPQQPKLRSLDTVDVSPPQPSASNFFTAEARKRQEVGRQQLDAVAAAKAASAAAAAAAFLARPSPSGPSTSRQQQPLSNEVARPFTFGTQHETAKDIAYKAVRASLRPEEIGKTQVAPFGFPSAAEPVVSLELMQAVYELRVEAQDQGQLEGLLGAPVSGVAPAGAASVADVDPFARADKRLAAAGATPGGFGASGSGYSFGQQQQQGVADTTAGARARAAVATAAPAAAAGAGRVSFFPQRQKQPPAVAVESQLPAGSDPSCLTKEAVQRAAAVPLPEDSSEEEPEPLASLQAAAGKGPTAETSAAGITRGKGPAGPVTAATGEPAEAKAMGRGGGWSFGGAQAGGNGVGPAGGRGKDAEGGAAPAGHAFKFASGGAERAGVAKEVAGKLINSKSRSASPGEAMEAGGVKAGAGKRRVFSAPAADDEDEEEVEERGGCGGARARTQQQQEGGKQQAASSLLEAPAATAAPPSAIGTEDGVTAPPSSSTQGADGKQQTAAVAGQPADKGAPYIADVTKTPSAATAATTGFMFGATPAGLAQAGKDAAAAPSPTPVPSMFGSPFVAEPSRAVATTSPVAFSFGNAAAATPPAGGTAAANPFAASPSFFSAAAPPENGGAAGAASLSAAAAGTTGATAKESDAAAQKTPDQSDTAGASKSSGAVAGFGAFGQSQAAARASGSGLGGGSAPFTFGSTAAAAASASTPAAAADTSKDVGSRRPVLFGAGPAAKETSTAAAPAGGFMFGTGATPGAITSAAGEAGTAPGAASIPAPSGTFLFGVAGATTGTVPTPAAAVSTPAAASTAADPPPASPAFGLTGASAAAPAAAVPASEQAAPVPALGGFGATGTAPAGQWSFGASSTAAATSTSTGAAPFTFGAPAAAAGGGGGAGSSAPAAGTTAAPSTGFVFGAPAATAAAPPAAASGSSSGAEPASGAAAPTGVASPFASVPSSGAMTAPAPAPFTFGATPAAGGAPSGAVLFGGSAPFSSTSTPPASTFQFGSQPQQPAASAPPAAAPGAPGTMFAFGGGASAAPAAAPAAAAPSFGFGAQPQQQPSLQGSGSLPGLGGFAAHQQQQQQPTPFAFGQPQQGPGFGMSSQGSFGAPQQPPQFGGFGAQPQQQAGFGGPFVAQPQRQQQPAAPGFGASQQQGPGLGAPGFGFNAAPAGQGGFSMGMAPQSEQSGRRRVKALRRKG